MKKKILITGGFGLLGSNLYKFLNEKKYDVYILDKKKNFIKKNYFRIAKKKVFTGNFLNEKLVLKIVKKKFDVIFHTGATTQVLEALEQPEINYKNNIFGTLNFLEKIRKYSPKTVFIFSSSDKAYGEVGKKIKSYKEDTPLNSIFPYDVSKSCADLICQSYSKTYDLKIGILRCGNLFGPGDLNLKRLIPECIMANLNNNEFKIRSSGKLVRDYLYIDDAVRAYYLTMIKLVKTKNKLLIFNVGSKYNLNVINLVNKINYFFGKKINLKIINNSKKEIKYQKLNDSKIKQILGWKQITNLDQGLKKTIMWYKKNIKKI